MKWLPITVTILVLLAVLILSGFPVRLAFAGIDLGQDVPSSSKVFQSGTGTPAATTTTSASTATAVPTNPSPPVTGATTPVPPISVAPGDIGVAATGRVSVKPDTALVTLGAQTTLPSLADATADVSKRSSAILDKVKAMGVDDRDITTVNYAIYPQSASPKTGEPPRITGYQVNNIVRIKVRKIDDVGKIIDAAVNAGANTVNSIQFTVDDPSSAQADARAQAVKNAIVKARQIADAAGLKLGNIRSITENVASMPIAVQRSFAAAPAAATDGAGPIESGQLDITVTIELHYDIAR